MIDGKNFFDEPVKSYMITYDNIRKVATGQRDNYTTGHLLGYNYFNNYFKMIAVDLSKQQELDTDLKVIQQINFTGNLYRAEGATMLLIIEEAKKPLYIFHKEL